MLLVVARHQLARIYIGLKLPVVSPHSENTHRMIHNRRFVRGALWIGNDGCIQVGVRGT